MKTQLILLNALSVAALLGWLGYHYLRDLASAFGNGNPAAGPGDVGPLFIVVALGTAACAVGSFFVPSGAGRILAACPLALLLLGQGFLVLRQRSNRERVRAEQAALRSVFERKLAGIPRDYQLPAEMAVGSEDFRESFLTYDRPHETLVRIDVGFRSEISAYPFGKIRNGELETLEHGDAFEKFHRRYVDREGRSVFDRYRCRHRPDLDPREFHLEQYAPSSSERGS